MSDTPETAPSNSVNRRGFLAASAAGALGISAAAFGPQVGRALAGSSASSSQDVAANSSLGGAAPTITHGVASGDITADGAIIWARSDRPAHMIVETSTDGSFHDPTEFRSDVIMDAASDFTGKLRLSGLPAGSRVFYRVFLSDAETAARSEPVAGSFRTAPTQPCDIRLHWSGDVVGQGYGINPEIGGLAGFSAMLARDPDLFLHSGDTVYSDNPLQENTELPDGRVWHNLTIPEKDKVAETLDEFRGQHRYNLMDDNYRAFNSQVAQIVQWDDHETANNWSPGDILTGEHGAKYTEKRVDVLAERAFQAFHEWQPIDPTRSVDGRVYRKISYGPLMDLFVIDMRSYKDSNQDNRADATTPGQILGEEQTRWLINEVTSSKATWKFIANDLPFGDRRARW